MKLEHLVFQFRVCHRPIGVKEQNNTKDENNNKVKLIKAQAHRNKHTTKDRKEDKKGAV